jgi:hypothetical protein
MEALATLIAAILKALIPALREAARDSCEDSAAGRELADRLKKKIRRSWPAVCLLFLIMAGCGTRSIYVPDGTPVRLRQTIKNAKVWVMDSKGKPVAAEMDLPEGWYCLSDSKGK